MGQFPKTAILDQSGIMRSTRVLICWLPMAILLGGALIAGPRLPAWAWMWTLSVAVFGGFKCATLWQALGGGVRPATRWRAPAYLLLWPGMDARGFLVGMAAGSPARAWAWAALKTGFGAVILWWVVRWMGGGLLAGWVGMTGLIFLLHFGSFDLLALFWRRQGVDASTAHARAGACGLAGRVLGHGAGTRASATWCSGCGSRACGRATVRGMATHDALSLFRVGPRSGHLAARAGRIRFADGVLSSCKARGCWPSIRPRPAAGALAGTVAGAGVDVAGRGGPGVLVVPSAVRAAGDAAVSCTSSMRFDPPMSHLLPTCDHLLSLALWLAGASDISACSGASVQVPARLGWKDTTCPS